MHLIAVENMAMHANLILALLQWCSFLKVMQGVL